MATYWLDGWNGSAKGGVFVRNSLKEIIEKCAANGMKVVGIIYDGSYNLELITEKIGD